jgi:hypothetical protein
MLGTMLESLDFGRFVSTGLLFATRKPAGNEEMGLATLNSPLPEVFGRFESSDGLGLGPNFTFGLLYLA